MKRPTIQPPTFSVGDRVRPRDGSEQRGTVLRVSAWPRVTAYRVAWDGELDAAPQLLTERELGRAL